MVTPDDLKERDAHVEAINKRHAERYRDDVTEYDPPLSADIEFAADEEVAVIKTQINSNDELDADVSNLIERFLRAKEQQKVYPQTLQHANPTAAHTTVQTQDKVSTSDPTHKMLFTAEPTAESASAEDNLLYREL